jgi:membrane dipeptidase
LYTVVDAHEDIAYNAIALKRDFLAEIATLRRSVAQASAQVNSKKWGTPTVSLPELERGNVRIVFSTLWAAPCGNSLTDEDAGTPCYKNSEEAHAQALDQLNYYRRLERDGRIRIIENKKQLKEHLEPAVSSGGGEEVGVVRGGPPVVGFVILMEGADPIRTPEEAREWFDLGLRIVGPAWHGTRYSGGTTVPGGLTDEGRALMKEMDHCGLMLDTSHMAEQSFFESLGLFGGVAIASHSNCRAYVPTDRQLSDEMIKALVSRPKGGVIGSVIYNRFLEPGWDRDKGAKKSDVTFAMVAKHMKRICEIAGDKKHVAIGSDLDGGFGVESTPSELNTVADLQRLGDALKEELGFSDNDIAGVLGGNWIRVLESGLPE